MTEMPPEEKNKERVAIPDEKEKTMPQSMHGVNKAILCRLPHCDKTFVADMYNKEFCCVEHQARFWELARKYGRVLLDEMRKIHVSQEE